MFKDTIAEIKKQNAAQGKPKERTMCIADSPYINPDVLKVKLLDPATPDNELYDILKTSYKYILKDIFDKKDTSYLDVFTTPRFISLLTQVLNSVVLTHYERITCNKLCYDYFTLKANDPYIKELLFILAKMVNKDKIPGLLGIGLPDNVATYMALARFSDSKETVNIKRLNFIIMTSSIHLMNPQMIVYIYEKLFDVASMFITQTMFDVFNDELEWVTDNIMEVYSNMSLAILVILNNLPSKVIRDILTSYTSEFTILYAGNMRAVRFSMRALSTDFNRIIAIAEQLEEEGIYVP